MDDTNTPARLARVTKRYGAVTALHGIDLELAAGETLALLGPNGAGKTTAIRTLLGIVAPDEGTATLFGRNPRVAKNRTRVGAMLQVAGVPGTLTVAEHVRLFATYYPHPLPPAETLQIAGLRGLEKRLYGELSGGQKQRVAFALAICGDPDALVLDEPTSALDVEARLALWSQIRAFVARGRSVLLTTHDLAEAEALADRIVVILGGRIVAEGTAAEIKARARTAANPTFAGATPLEAAFLTLTQPRCDPESTSGDHDPNRCQPELVSGDHDPSHCHPELVEGRKS